MSWLRGKNLTSDHTTPENPNGKQAKPRFRSGLLTIRVLWAEGLALPAGVAVPTVVSNALSSQQAKVAASVSPSSVHQQRLAKKSKGNRDSVQRTQCWWLPYLVMEYEVNQVLITPLGGDLEKPLYMYQAHFDVSRNSEISLQCYLRTEEPNCAGDGLADNLETISSWSILTIDDFELMTVISKGQLRQRSCKFANATRGRIYALKTIRKAHIVSRNEITHTLAERLVLAQVDSPFIVPLKFSFQSEQKLYLVLAFVNGGELFHHLQREHTFNEERARFYSAELLLALEHLHELDVVYRDLKPENILLDYTGPHRL
ncbi:AGC/NDR protein kinase [Coprinopsis cinerea AmutBmut pab1-1]|nr:AGC/NDR protein kinase [Coprinopsis cinerea AmutBmut pab1-1]